VLGSARDAVPGERATEEDVEGEAGDDDDGDDDVVEEDPGTPRGGGTAPAVLAQVWPTTYDAPPPALGARSVVAVYVSPLPATLKVPCVSAAGLERVVPLPGEPTRLRGTVNAMVPFGPAVNTPLTWPLLVYFPATNLPAS